MKTGVYQIRNLVNSKCYIGSSANQRGLHARLGEHKRKLNSGNHENQYLQHAWDKHGEASFVFEILEQCLPKKCIIREQHYLDTLLFAGCDDNRFKDMGYNILRNAGSPLGRKHSKAAKNKMSKAKQNEGNTTAKLTHSQVLKIRDLIKSRLNNTVIAKRYGVSNSAICDIRYGRRWKFLTGFDQNNATASPG